MELIGYALIALVTVVFVVMAVTPVLVAPKPPRRKRVSPLELVNKSHSVSDKAKRAA